MGIRHWPASERPREKLLARGVASLSDGELLAILLRSGVRGHSAVSLGRNLLAVHGGLRAVMAADQSALCAQPGVGQATWSVLQACAEINRRCLWAAVDTRTGLDNPHAAADVLRAELAHLSHEVFACLWLDNRHRVLAFEVLFRGTLDSASVYPREVVKRALAVNAAAVIFAHNHPSGCAEPSAADRDITGALRRALALVSVRVLDHLVVGVSDTVSLAERGWLT
ncbi:MAG: DNA repair protein RadC [Pseudomonadota bacterium]